MLCPQIWCIEEEKGREREPEKVGDSPTKLNEEKSERELEREIKNKGDIFCWQNKLKIL